MERQEVVSRLVQSGAVGIIRVQENEDLVRIAHALQAGGLKCVEITMNSVGALHAIEKARRDLPDIIMGAGTVLDGATARHAILAGAEFIVTPTVEPDVIEMAHRYGVVIIPGAMSPTEILTAWELGVDMVKVFPADVLGPAYLKAIHGPLSQIPLAPTGGITANNAGEFIKAGAAIVSAGGWLVNKKAIIEGRYEEITKRAQQLIQAVKEARGESGE
ncbi:MAG: bifunctional 4-hydroxy-2-oxoglutarate aldolase/2-dehydro-3-deoxy-phosphogluconate aldolase [Palaeococcus sp.]|uniref:bifunctional 4-hydroxy-2-oxoglutarate aldolase/2-dehydro-3-deoxy-phosphogluconate aldolase n=1 Tax=Palaeococcus sp. (in: euryarchaeotes) TaxID=2820298 RepID=UPI0025D9CFC9|nr:bifunctional 4-hydroxy-2-oxoglutarate aldolase/2-dehydro-3-deoxy-phosphogluconate aldolase [Palaeococcus sp. (in: euryarchaeotes)]MCD6558621.1 bifunctional 4-hydroxy-2-oxoglutarate aldolase/2-dehydro-3-deoxy-phosphogluconate aldolase [Palaeococcus sp. (in: euryarchaeotes)]